MLTSLGLRQLSDPSGATHTDLTFRTRGGQGEYVSQLDYIFTASSVQHHATRLYQLSTRWLVVVDHDAVCASVHIPAGPSCTLLPTHGPLNFVAIPVRTAASNCTLRKLNLTRGVHPVARGLFASAVKMRLFRETSILITLDEDDLAIRRRLTALQLRFASYCTLSTPSSRRH
jgi:hypothetical protein